MKWNKYVYCLDFGGYIYLVWWWLWDISTHWKIYSEKDLLSLKIPSIFILWVFYFVSIKYDFLNNEFFFIKVYKTKSHIMQLVCKILSISLNVYVKWMFKW